ncbi:hypothetical protein OCAR_5323 [Afipia carboxidovorans OM5]|nr:hypothetical protein OCAR_5323 [Afipia carboxidovorans OM5]
MKTKSPGASGFLFVGDVRITRGEVFRRDQSVDPRLISRSYSFPHASDAHDICRP